MGDQVRQCSINEELMSTKQYLAQKGLNIGLQGAN